MLAWICERLVRRNAPAILLVFFVSWKEWVFAAQANLKNFSDRVFASQLSQTSTCRQHYDGTGGGKGF